MRHANKLVPTTEARFDPHPQSPTPSLTLTLSLTLDMTLTLTQRRSAHASCVFFFSSLILAWPVWPALSCPALPWPALAWPGPLPHCSAHKSMDPANAGGNYRDVINKYFCI